MSLSTMQEIFILLEDEREVPYYRLKRWGRPARGALAKLKSLGLVDKTITNSETFYTITKAGEEYADDVLGLLKTKKGWDKKWRLIMFEIPETQRALRDKLRRKLTSLGLGILQSSVWITPNDIKNEIEEIRNSFDLGSQLKYFEVSATPTLNQQIIEKSWNIPAINLELERFVKDATWAMKAMGKGNGDRFNAKKLVFEYALILKSGPVLPPEFIEKNEVRKKAQDAYFKLREYIV